jgi:hypothetical protein
MSLRRSTRQTATSGDSLIPPAPAENCPQCAELWSHTAILEGLHAARLRELSDPTAEKARERNWHAERAGLQARVKALEDAADAQFRAHVKLLRDLGLHDLAHVQAASAPVAITTTTDRFMNNTAANYAPAASGSRSRSGKKSAGGHRM